MDQSESSSSLLNENLLKSASNTSNELNSNITNFQEIDDPGKSVSAMSIGKRLLSNLIPSSAFQSLKIPFPDEEHYLLSTESQYYINDKYLTSIIAFSLSSKEYKDFQASSSKIDLVKLNQQASFAIHSNPSHGKDSGLTETGI